MKMSCKRKFKTLMDVVKYELNVYTNYTARWGHVPAAKRNNRTIAENICTQYHNPALQG